MESTKTTIEDLCAAASGPHPIGLGHVAVVEYDVVPAEDPPESGAGWAADRDWPGVSVTLSLPTSDATWGGKTLHPDLATRDPEFKPMGAQLYAVWGRTNDADGTMWRREVIRHSSLRVALAKAKERGEEALDLVRRTVGYRAKRLAEREAIIAHAMET